MCVCDRSPAPCAPSPAHLPTPPPTPCSLHHRPHLSGSLLHNRVGNFAAKREKLDLDLVCLSRNQPAVSLFIFLLTQGGRFHASLLQRSLPAANQVNFQAPKSLRLSDHFQILTLVRSPTCGPLSGATAQVRRLLGCPYPQSFAWH